MAANVLVTMGLVTALALAVGCGGGDGSGPPPANAPTPTITPPPPTPTPVTAVAVLARSGGVMERLSTFHFLLEHEIGSTQFLPGLRVNDVEGDIVRPDSLVVELSGSFGGFAVKASVIALGDTTYMTNPLSGGWEELETGVSPLGFFDPGKGIATIMARVYEAGEVSIAGDVFRIDGMLPSDALKPLLGVTLTDSPVSVALKIDAADGYLREARIEGQVTPTDLEGVIRMITLTRFDEPVAIEPPE